MSISAGAQLMQLELFKKGLRKCPKCKKVKPLSEFARHSQTKSGMCYCLLCNRAASLRRHREIKAEAFAHYGSKCRKCGEAGDDFLRYGCMDVWATSCSWLYLMEALPDWAWENYLLKFPLNFPSLLCGIRGWKIDQERRANIRSEQIPAIRKEHK